MKKITCLLLLIQSGYLVAQSKTVVTPFGEKIAISTGANNGLTANNGFIQLGGDLIQPSILTTTAANTLAINGLQTGGSSDNVLVTDSNGVLRYIPRTSFGGGADNLGNHIATQNLMMNRNDVVFADRLTSNTKTFSLYKDNAIFGIYNSSKGSNSLSITEAGHVGIGTTSPTNTLHVKATADPVKIEGLAGSSNSNDAPLVIASDGTLKKGAFPVINIVPSEVGTVIAIGGKLEVAQEITAQMGADFSTASGSITPIGNISNIIIDNKSKFTNSSNTNQFSVTATGTYLITINSQISETGTGVPVVGIVDNNTGKWVARVNDNYGTASVLQTYTLVTSINMDQTHTYSFAMAASGGTMTVRAFSSGSTGIGPVSFFSVKRLR